MQKNKKKVIKLMFNNIKRYLNSKNKIYNYQSLIGIKNLFKGYIIVN